MSDTIVSRAKALAHRAHAGQVDKAGRPYIEHVARVAAAIRKDDCCGFAWCYHGFDHFVKDSGRCYYCDVAEAVAWLHDVFEDSPDFVVANEREFFSFPDEVMKSVIAITRAGHDLESDAFYYICIRMDAIALRVKLADIADNSSEDRLALLDEKTAARLRRKYAKAIAALTGGQ